MRELLRSIRLTPYRKELRTMPSFTLRTFDTGRTDSYGKCILAYEFRMRDRVRHRSTLLFEGADYHCAPGDPIDSDASLRGLLTFLTLRPGDTDAEWFERYTPAQLDYANAHAEAVCCEVYARFGED